MAKRRVFQRRRPSIRTSNHPRPQWEMAEMAVDLDDELSVDYFSGVRMIPKIDDDEDGGHARHRRIHRAESPMQNMLRAKAADGWMEQLEGLWDGRH